MAQVRNNIIIKGLSGSIGNQLVFKQDKAGRTIVGAPPSIDPDRTYSEAELERQEVFRDATVYAKGAKGEAVYIEKAEGTPMSAYNVAIADWFHGPEIREIDIENWSGAVGEVIRIQVVDNVKVAKVNVVISNSEGAVLEQGVAVPAEGAWLTYTTTATAQNGAQLVVTAEDLPGNVTDMSVVFSD